MNSLFRPVYAAALLLCAATPTTAQSLFERMEVAVETMSGLMNQGLISQVPALEGNLPDPEWDDAMRGAYRCTFDRYVEEAGEASVEALVTQMEVELVDMTPERLLNGEGFDSPEGISDALAEQIATNCGVIELFMARMEESGAFGIMMQQQ